MSAAGGFTPASMLFGLGVVPLDPAFFVFGDPAFAAVPFIALELLPADVRELAVREPGLIAVKLRDLDLAALVLREDVAALFDFCPAPLFPRALTFLFAVVFFAVFFFAVFFLVAMP